MTAPAEPRWRAEARARHGQAFVDAAAAAAAALPPMTEEQIAVVRRVFATAPAHQARTRTWTGVAS